MQLDPAAVANDVRLATYASVGSTNAEALVRARAGERGPLWIVAGEQTGGRGRRGRSWISPPGNLYASLLLTEAGAPGDAAQLSFVTALAVFDAIVSLAPELHSRLSLKWPNDVLCDSRKICGILLEGETSSARTATVVIGIGINCRHHPDDTEFPATSLAILGVQTSPDAVFAKLSVTMLQRLEQWNRGAGFAAVRADWLSHAPDLGHSIRVRHHDRETFGIFQALDERGQLILSYPDGGFEVIAAGDVFPLGTMAAERT